MRLVRTGAGFLILLVACAKPQREPAKEDAALPIAMGPASAPTPSDAAAEATTAVPASAITGDPRFTEAAPRGGRSLGHTSVVFKVELASGVKAVFKPSTRRGPKRYKGEIAAYRLGVALGLDANVPRAWFRTFEGQALNGALAGPARELYAAEAIIEDGRVKGAIIPWLDDLDFVPLERETAWKAWLAKGGAIPEADKARAADIASMICFDWLTANWDRWSGGNVGLGKTTGRLLFVDNDGAFFETPPKDGLARTKKLLEAMDRFPRGLVARIRMLTEARIAEILGEESRFVPLLSPKAMAGVAARAGELLAIVDAKAGDAGADETLFFP